MAKVELFATAFTTQAYHCFHDLADVEMNAQGYGYPDWLPGYCSLRGESFAAGVVQCIYQPIAARLLNHGLHAIDATTHY